MIHADIEMEMPRNCGECPFCQIADSKFRCVVSRVSLKDDCFGRRPFWCCLQDTKPKTMLHFKSQLCDGHVHMTAHDFVEHGVMERIEKQKMKLKKLANNPALSDDVRKTLHVQINYVDMGMRWRNEYCALREKYDKLRKETGR